MSSSSRAGARATRSKAWPGPARRPRCECPDGRPSREAETVGAATLAANDHRCSCGPAASFRADGDIVEGHASVEEAILTGEVAAARPGERRSGPRGSVVRDGALVVRVTAAGGATRLAAIERLVDRAAGDRPRVARVADRVATWFVGALLVLAAVTAFAWGDRSGRRSR